MTSAVKSRTSALSIFVRLTHMVRRTEVGSPGVQVYVLSPSRMGLSSSIRNEEEGRLPKVLPFADWAPDGAAISGRPGGGAADDWSSPASSGRWETDRGT